MAAEIKALSAEERMKRRENKFTSPGKGGSVEKKGGDEKGSDEKKGEEAQEKRKKLKVAIGQRDDLKGND